jgi:hypothetical protein
MPLRLADMPDWPAVLTRDEAAAYLRVSVETFEAEIAKGWWPEGTPRGAKGGKLTWLRAALDRRAPEHFGEEDDDGLERRMAASAAWREEEDRRQR